VINTLVALQPIEVCADDGSGCATPDISGFETAANKIFSQAGLGLVFLPVSQLRDSSYQTTIVDPSGNPIDQAHQLLRLPNAAQSPNPTTLDVYFVSSLQQHHRNLLFVFWVRSKSAFRHLGF
jgi:hypothetical protein